MNMNEYLRWIETLDPEDNRHSGKKEIKEE